MHPSRRHLAMALAVAAAGTAVAIGPVQAETYPDRAVRLVVPFAPGGSTDIIARYVAEPLRLVLKQPVIVDNKAGAGGMLGTAEVARAKPDGYTLSVGTVSTMVVFPAAHPKPGYTIEQFAPVTNMAVMPNVIAVHPSFPAKDLKEFIEVLKANPDKYSYATSGKGSINHMLGESFQAGTGVKINHIPYRGSGPAMQDVMGGQVDMLFDQLPSSKTFIDSGKLRLIGVIAPKRVAEYPDVMTMEEVGIKGFTDQAWYGILAPAKVPPEVMTRLTEAMKEVMSNPDLIARLQKAGFTPLGNSSAEYAAQIKGEVEAMKKLVKERNISLDE